MIPFSPPDISEVEIALVTEALKSGWITTGPMTKRLEKEVAEYCAASRCVCLNSATAGLELALRLLEIGPGDEVITSAYTYTASASVIEHVGATIVLVDTKPGSYEMDYHTLADSITDKTKAIIPVDIGGVPCDYDAIYATINSKKNLYTPSNPLQAVYGRPVIIADAAHSFGSTYKGKRTGVFADFNVFSFHAVKNFTTAEGGAVTWVDREGIDSDDIYQRFQLLSLHGQNKDALAKTKIGSWEYDIVIPGYKCNMTDVAAAIGLGQMQRFEGLLDRRFEIYQQYAKVMDELGVAYLHQVDDKYQGNAHLFLCRLPGFDEEMRNQFIVAMAEQGVSCNVHYKPLPMMTAYKTIGFSIDDYPAAHAQYCNEVTLPLHTLLSDEDVTTVLSSFRKAMEAVKS